MTRSLTDSMSGVVFECQNGARIESDLRTRLTLEGYAIVDWESEWSLESSDADKPKAAGRAFNIMRSLGECGGYGVVYTKKNGAFEDVTIGRVTPRCIHFRKYSDASTGELRKFKLVQFDEWAVMTGEELEEEFDDVYAVLDNLPERTPTMTEVDVYDDFSIPRAFCRLDLAGELQRRN